MNDPYKKTPISNSIRTILDEYYEATKFESDSDDDQNDKTLEALGVTRIVDSVLSELEEDSKLKSESLRDSRKVDEVVPEDSAMRHEVDENNSIDRFNSEDHPSKSDASKQKMPFLRKGSRKEPSALHRFQQNVGGDCVVVSNIENQEEKMRLQELEKMQEQQRENLKKRIEKRQLAREEIRKRHYNSGSEICASTSETNTEKNNENQEKALKEHSSYDAPEEIQSTCTYTDDDSKEAHTGIDSRSHKSIKGSNLSCVRNRDEIRKGSAPFSKDSQLSPFKRQEIARDLKSKQKMKESVVDDKKNDMEDQWQVIKCMRKRQENALRDAEKEREEARSWAAQERDRVQRWVDNQKKNIEKERQKLSNEVMIWERKKRHDQLEEEASEAASFSYKKAKEEINALKESLSKQKIESDAAKSRQRLNEKRLRDIISDKEREIISIAEQLESAEIKKASLLEQKEDFINRIKQLESKLKRASKQKDLCIEVISNESRDQNFSIDENHNSKLNAEESYSILDKFDLEGEIVDQDDSPDKKTKRALANNYDLVQDSNESWLRSHLDKLQGQPGDTSSDKCKETSCIDSFTSLKDQSYDPFKYMSKSNEEFHATTTVKPLIDVHATTETKDVQSTLNKVRRVITYSNNTEKEILPDGTTICRFSNGDVKTTYSNIGIVVYFYAKSGTSHTTHADGLEVFEFASGQVERHFQNGEREVIFPDGTKQFFHLNGKSDIIYPDGIKVSEESSKKMILNF